MALTKILHTIFEARYKERDLDNKRDNQEHAQGLDVSKMLAEQLKQREEQLEKREERIEKLRSKIHEMGDKYTLLAIKEGQNEVRITQLETRAVDCEQDRDKIRERLDLLEKKEEK